LERRPDPDATTSDPSTDRPAIDRLFDGAADPDPGAALNTRPTDEPVDGPGDHHP
jgi:hypothetical protein